MHSNHKVDVFRLGELTKHPNADSLSLIKIGDTDYTYVARTEEWKNRVGQMVAWVPPDSLVKVERPEFSFLKEMKSKHPERVRAKKLRGVVSYGLLVLAPEGLKEGDDAASLLEVTHYEPQIRQPSGPKAQFASTDAIPGPALPGYDIEAYLKYGRKVFVTGEMVYITEKLHGACGRYVYIDGQMHVGSRNEWKSEYSLPSKLTYQEILEKVLNPEKAQTIYDRISKPGTRRNMWWEALTPAIENWCRAHPGHCVYGEVFGNVQDMKYGATNEVWFRAFDILLPSGQWMDAEQFVQQDLIRVPEVARMGFEFEAVRALCEGDSLIGPHIREGVVVKPMKERWDQRIGRVSLKIINPVYLEK